MEGEGKKTLAVIPHQCYGVTTLDKNTMGERRLSGEEFCLKTTDVDVRYFDDGTTGPVCEFFDDRHEVCTKIREASSEACRNAARVACGDEKKGEGLRYAGAPCLWQR
ncbi:MAG: hypothetical protein UT33_C0005G0086 [Candidatus Peregrinibacteria bacterium GW2011_GWC2_39_14]|nr:MAG: hypothetical protein US92_C0001G0086 [Candidatus Peregrinibacteria bacterium GW2011_GWA2_38_36]KKR07142.1 MAG: hypothetical protein UT33_C0005G0086 [Candidatus Peregrinibacteria bacterium GW2011_GWC2_39_14]